MKPLTKLAIIASVLTAMLTITGCNTINPRALSEKTVASPAAWQARIPAANELGAALSAREWWSGWSDPTLERMHAAARAHNPDLEQSLARIDQARAATALAQAQRWPNLNLSARFSRGRNLLLPPGLILDTAQVLVDALWEIDLWGTQRAAVTKADSRVRAREADWHQGSVSLNAEVASTHVSLVACQLAVALALEDARLIGANQTLAADRVRTGFAATDVLASAAAGTRDAERRVTAQREQCDLAFKAQTMLTGLNELDVRAAYGERGNAMPMPRRLAIASVPASALTQRADLAAIERELAAVSIEIEVIELGRLPKPSLVGQVGRLRAEGQGFSAQGTNWSFGPQLSMPIFDFGRRRANLEQSQGRYRELEASYRQRAQLAVREVEESLVRLESARVRALQAEASVAEQQRVLSATEERLRTGFGNGSDRNDAARLVLNARSVVVDATRDELTAWISLYKAVGGGWAETDTVTRSER